uniref:Uncharacterized protein n=1 Tax=viral metagenome TaxID=1070528 RepID=A0A6M3K3I0_9ZZZZ
MKKRILEGYITCPANYVASLGEAQASLLEDHFINGEVLGYNGIQKDVPPVPYLKVRVIVEVIGIEEKYKFQREFPKFPELKERKTYVEPDPIPAPALF